MLVADALPASALALFRAQGVRAEQHAGLSPAELRAVIGEYDGLAVRAATRVTRELLEAAPRLRVVGRAGAGVDTIDVTTATARGVVVMNTPHADAITTAEHAIALMLALARHVPAADAAMRKTADAAMRKVATDPDYAHGTWRERLREGFLGTELTGKTLGVIGCGSVGAIVADRALGLRMRVVAYDPYLTERRALELGVEKLEFDALLARADVLSLHLPLTDATRNILSREAIARTRHGVRIVNCARAGLIDEAALAEAIGSSQVAGAALDVLSGPGSPLLAMPEVVCTPGLGAATHEAREKVALQLAGQMCGFLLGGVVENAVNLPAISAEEAPRLRPTAELCRLLGAFAGQLTRAQDGVIRRVAVELEGGAAALNARALTAAALTGLLSPLLADVNMVSAPVVARARGIEVAATAYDRAGEYHTLVRITVETDAGARSVAGTLFAGDRPRLVAVKGIAVEADFAPRMLYVTNQDRPGFIGRFGETLAEAGINIATFHLGRAAPGGDAICLAAVDQPVGDAVLARLRALPLVVQATVLAF